MILIYSSVMFRFQFIHCGSSSRQKLVDFLHYGHTNTLMNPKNMRWNTVVLVEGSPVQTLMSFNMKFHQLLV